MDNLHEIFSFIDFSFEGEGLSATSSEWEEIVCGSVDDFTILANHNVETPHQRMQLIYRFK